jgi:predicted RNase H-like HicB family nuclease
MLDNYLDRAMQHAQYKRIVDGTCFGTIPGFDGVWANGQTEQECQKALREVLEGWILLSIEHHAPLPEIDGMRLEVGESDLTDYHSSTA